MRVNENVAALNMHQMLIKGKSMINSNQKIKISRNEESVKNFAINEKMKSQIRDFIKAEGNSCDEETSLNEAITTMQDITGILGDMQEILQTIQSKMSLKDDCSTVSNRYTELVNNFVDVSNSEIFNSKWFKSGLMLNHEINSKDFNTCDIDQIKELARSYQRKIEELEEINSKFKKEIDTGQVDEANFNAAKYHVQNIATAEEIVGKTKKLLLHETKKAMLSQANQKPEQVISLLE